MADYYNDDAVLMPGRGAVLIAPVKSEIPTSDQLAEWVKSGATGPLGDYSPLGYTSLDELPGFESDVEGGEVKGVWENPQLRTSAVKVSESVTITPVEWVKTPLEHRFGPGKIDDGKGHFVIPEAYSTQQVSILVVLLDGERALGLCYFKCETAPGDKLELDSENFAGIPVKYTILSVTGEGRGVIIAGWLKAKDDSDGSGEVPTPSS